MNNDDVLSFLIALVRQESREVGDSDLIPISATLGELGFCDPLNNRWGLLELRERIERAFDIHLTEEEFPTDLTAHDLTLRRLAMHIETLQNASDRSSSDS